MCPVTDDTLIGSTESSRILDVDKATLSRWVSSGVITPVHKLPGRNGAYVFSRRDVEKLAAQRTQASA